jgi:hypothetical protein
MEACMLSLPVPCGVQGEDKLGQKVSEANSNWRRDDTPALQHMQLIVG